VKFSLRRRERKQRNFESLRGAVAAVAIAVLLPMAMLFTVAWMFGWRLEFVQTASMEPGYPVDSLLIAESIDPSDVRAGMAITYLDPGGRDRLVTHRVVRVEQTGGELSFITRGDANVADDPFPVPAANVRSRVRWHVPFLGGWMYAMRWPRNGLLLIGVPALVLVVGEYRDRRHRSAQQSAATDAVDCGDCGLGLDLSDSYCRRCGTEQQRDTTKATTPNDSMPNDSMPSTDVVSAKRVRVRVQ
jgi:signal peptidase